MHAKMLTTVLGTQRTLRLWSVRYYYRLFYTHADVFVALGLGTIGKSLKGWKSLSDVELKQ